MMGQGVIFETCALLNTTTLLITTSDFKTDCHLQYRGRYIRGTRLDTGRSLRSY